MQPRPDANPVRIADPKAAEALVAHVMSTMQALSEILAEESGHVRAGRLREGLSQAERKSALSGAYLQGLESAKANAIALARFAPRGVEVLKAAHQRFMIEVETNQAVLATARSVSEGLIKTLAEEIGRSRSATVYGVPSIAPSPYGRGARSGPLVLSRSL
ncbi:hypothetical protein [Methylobacterium soli]|uniref:Flagellar protein FlgN n=1 Tax=Methylobacterium soli TaxID=553447 RepID=A0A6L3SZ70_9HYPH|nr:hypothetical protein [Methylobacterium soli]KAB1078915.1 hypothetical protein F6X53_12990 [Methylobacterium soli]GJE44412.1 hypothetical protein AEGHOMDF_3600 [Methylobacterium soli]